MDKKLKTYTKKNTWLYIVVVAAVVLATIMILLFIEVKVRRARNQTMLEDELRIVEIQRDFIGREFNVILSDARYLHRAYKDRLMASSNCLHTCEKWRIFSGERRVYDQIRYLNELGDERIRINFDSKHAYIVDSSDMQNKKGRHYFDDAIDLEDGQVYVSVLDLNKEHGEVEVPHKPMIRLSVPVRDNGDLKGVIVLNFLADYTLSRFRELNEGNIGDMMLVNKDGYKLSSRNKEDDWAFMFPDRVGKSFAVELPEQWEKIKSGEFQFTAEDGVYTIYRIELEKRYQRIDIESDMPVIAADKKWYIVSHFPRNAQTAHFFTDNYWNIFTHTIKTNVLTLVLSAALSLMVAYMVTQSRRQFMKIKYYSEYDALTKAYNRRAGVQMLNDMFRLSGGNKTMVSLCFIDVNGLKSVNDNLGHNLGDELIVTVAEVVKSTIRESDFLIRLGGDEFLIVLKNSDLQQSEMVWERIVKSFDHINETEDRSYIISVSHGIVDYSLESHSSVDNLINEADEKMYEEKQVIKRDLDVLRKDSVPPKTIGKDENAVTGEV